MDSIADLVEFTDIDIADTKYVEEQMCFANRRTLIIVTIDDPQISQVDIQKLMERGMNVVRLKTSNFSKNDKVDIIEKIDSATKYLARKYGIRQWPCATCLDLKTSTVQTGVLLEDVSRVYIKKDSQIILTTEKCQYDKCSEYSIFVDNPCLTLDTKIGMEIIIDQDEIVLICTGKDATDVNCRVIKGGYLRSMAYVCMRGSVRTQPLLTKIDYQLIQFAMEYQVEMIIVNYSRTIETLLKIRKFLGSNLQKRPLIIVGLCTIQGLMNIDDFVQSCDGILLSREFLSFELEKNMCHRMGRIQSFVAGKCRQVGIPFYISGDVFQEALRTGHVCTREISDLTNALMEWTSGFVLSEYNNIPNLCSVMNIMNDVCTGVEPLSVNKTDFWHKVTRLKMPVNAAEACALSCAVVANQTNARVIILPTVSGRTAAILNSLHPNSIVIAVSTKFRTVRILNSFRGVEPLLYKGPPCRVWFDTVQARVRFALIHAIKHNWIICDDYYISLEKATEESSFCDAVRVWKVTEKETNTNKMDCPNSYHDFDVNSFYVPPPPVKKKKPSEITAIAEEVEQGKEGEEKENVEENAEGGGEEKIKDENEATNELTHDVKVKYSQQDNK